MRLARIVVVDFATAPAAIPARVQIGNLQVDCVRDAVSPHRIVLAGVLPLTSRSDSKDGWVEVPEDELTQCEYFLEAVANLLAFSNVAGRSIMSPVPHLGLLPDDDHDREWLSRQRGFALDEYRHGVGWFRQPLDLDQHTPHLLDRLDGVELFSEALSNTNAAGTFREFMRVFERAFARADRTLIDPLANFLGKGPFDYTRDEVVEWIELRGGLSHADQGFYGERDVLAELPRVQQAARDVLLNKLSWRSPSSARRTVWTPVVWTGSSALYMTGGVGSQGQLEHIMLDQVGSYRLLLTGAALQVPDEWWPRVDHGTPDSSAPTHSPSNT